MEHQAFKEIVTRFVEDYNAKEMTESGRLEVQFSAQSAQLIPKGHWIWSPALITAFLAEHAFFGYLGTSLGDNPRPCFGIYHD